MKFTLSRQPRVGVLQLHQRSVVQPLINQANLTHARRSVVSQATHASPETLASLVKIFGTRVAQSGCAAAIALALALHPSPAAAVLETSSASSPVVSNDTPFLDLAKVMPAGKLDSLQTQLRQLEADTGYKLRVLSRFGPSNVPTIEEIRSGWGVDEKTVVVFVDPSAPNIMTFRFGLGVQKILPRPFFTELQSRLGNQFFVRENGEQAAVYGMLDAMDTCFRREGGCRVPPGLPSEQYYFTLGCAVAGGLILGSVLRIDPQGFVKRRWVYGLLFAPLWASLSINFGLGPIISRTDDIMPVIANVAATVAAALLIFYYPQAAKATGLSMMSDDDDDKYGNSDWE
jgi:hypothetical protein